MNKQEAIKATYKASTYGKVGITKLDTFTNGFDSGAEWQAEQDKDEAILFAEWISNNNYHFTKSCGWLIHPYGRHDRFMTTQDLFDIYKTGL